MVRNAFSAISTSIMRFRGTSRSPESLRSPGTFRDFPAVGFPTATSAACSPTANLAARRRRYEPSKFHTAPFHRARQIAGGLRKRRLAIMSAAFALPEASLTRNLARIGCITVLALACTSAVDAQSKKQLADYTVTTWTDKDGLPSGRVRALAQDQRGYLWLGTDNGVIRFDGIRFVPWDALGLPAVPHATVSTLLSARDGSLWIGFEVGGVAR